MGSFAGLLTLLLALSICVSSEERITCEAGQFTAGQTASVTCNFHHYINRTRHRIFVLHYPFSTFDHFSGETVLKCRHLHRQKPECMVTEGYEFNNIIKNHVTLRIPEVKKAFAGRYLCQIVPLDGRLMNACNLNVNETIFTSTTADTTQPDAKSKTLKTIFTSTTADTTQPDTDSKTLRTIFTSTTADTTQPDIESKTSNIPELGLYVGMAVVMVTLLCAIAYIANRMRKLERINRTLQENQEQAPPLLSDTVVGDTQTDDSVVANP